MVRNTHTYTQTQKGSFKKKCCTDLRLPLYLLQCMADALGRISAESDTLGYSSKKALEPVSLQAPVFKPAVAAHSCQALAISPAQDICSWCEASRCQKCGGHYCSTESQAPTLFGGCLASAVWAVLFLSKGLHSGAEAFCLLLVDPNAVGKRYLPLSSLLFILP